MNTKLQQRQDNTWKKSRKDNPTEYYNDYNDIDYPIFDLRYMHKDYSINTKKVQKDDKVRLMSTLYKLSQHSWQALQLAPRHGMGYEKIAKNDINPSIPDCKWISPDTVFFAFRYHGLKSMVGIKKGSTFLILYIDYNYTVYDH